MSDYPSSFGNIVYNPLSFGNIVYTSPPDLNKQIEDLGNIIKNLQNKIVDLTNIIEDLQERVTVLEYNPGPGGPKYQETYDHYNKVVKGEIKEF